jgi:hypothetical protein
VGQPTGIHLSFQGFGNMGLTHHILKGARPPFSVKSLVQNKMLLSSLIKENRPTGDQTAKKASQSSGHRSGRKKFKS